MYYAPIYSWSSITQILPLKSDFDVHFSKNLCKNQFPYWKCINIHLVAILNIGLSLFAHSSVFMLQWTLTPLQSRFIHRNHVCMCIISTFIHTYQFRYWKCVDQSSSILVAILTFGHLQSPSRLCLCFFVLLQSYKLGFIIEIMSLCAVLSN